MAPEELARLACQHFELPSAPVATRALPSYEDQNALVTCEEGDSESEAKAPRTCAFVVKLANARLRRARLELENRFMTHLKRKGVTVPRVLMPRHAQSGYTSVSLDVGGQARVLRVVSYLEGALLEDALPASPELLGALGGFLGRVDAHSLEFELEDGEQELVNERAENPWNIDSCAQSVRGLREYLATQAQGELVNHFLQVYEQRFLASHRAARKALLHNDFNEQNVLVDSATRTRVVGLIDFGDMALTAVINSPAIALTYLLLRSRDLAGDGVAFLRAYRAALPLRGEELVLLQPLIAMRLCVSLCMAARQSKLDPGNAHTQIANDDKWALLRKLREFSPERAAAAWTPP